MQKQYDFPHGLKLQFSIYNLWKYIFVHTRTYIHTYIVVNNKSAMNFLFCAQVNLVHLAWRKAQKNTNYDAWKTKAQKRVTAASDLHIKLPIELFGTKKNWIFTLLSIHYLISWTLTIFCERLQNYFVYDIWLFHQQYLPI